MRGGASCWETGGEYSEPMTKNPFINAILAGAYIVGVVAVIATGENLGPDESILIPMAILSLFVLSALAMGFIFFFQPVQMYLDGSKKEAVDLVVKTIATFAGITALFFAVLFFFA